MWNVGGLDPRLVKALTVLGFALPVLGYILLVQHYQVNAIWQDQWDDVVVIRHFPQWSSLWNQHTDNRVLFPNLIVVALAHTVHYNIDVEEYLSVLMLFGATALFIWSHKRRSPNTPLLFYCPVAFLTLTLSQWQNALWGFQMAWYLVAAVAGGEHGSARSAAVGCPAGLAPVGMADPRGRCSRGSRWQLLLPAGTAHLAGGTRPHVPPSLAAVGVRQLDRGRRGHRGLVLSQLCDNSC